MSISISPTSALLSVPVTVTVRGLPPASRVTVSASATDASHTAWKSAATFKVPADGVLSLSQPALSGSYTGVDPMGLLLSMVPPSCTTPYTGACALDAVSGSTFIAPADGYTVTLTAKVGPTTVAKAAAHRENPLHGAVHDRPLRPRADRLYGDLLTPSTDTSARRPGILVVGGSEGGDSGARYVASILAANGYPALALAYFGEPGIPQQLQDIPLEYFTKAFALLRAQPDVDPRRVLIMGASRGGELALLLGATYPTLVDGVIAGVPSSQVNGGYPSGGAAWTLHGKPVPRRPIPVENIEGPILQACATQDIIWPSCSFVSQITTRLTAHHFAYPVTTLRFVGGGHSAGSLECCLSMTNSLGGTTDANALAQSTGLKALLSFLSSQR